MKTFAVIGLGRFGSAVAEELCKLGHEVLAVDASEEPIQEFATATVPLSPWATIWAPLR